LQKDEDCKKAVADFIQADLNLPVSEVDIEAAHPVRLGRAATHNHNQKLPDAVIVRFRQRNT